MRMSSRVLAATAGLLLVFVLLAASQATGAPAAPQADTDLAMPQAVPGWWQMNETDNTPPGPGLTGLQVTALEAWNGRLYAAFWDNSTGFRLWRFIPGIGWRMITENGFGVPANVAAMDLAPFGTSLYAGTRNASGPQVWRIWTTLDAPSSENVTPAGGFGTANLAISKLQAFGSYLYAGTEAASGGAEVWRTDATTWTRVSQGGFGDANNTAILSLAVHNGRLYAGTANAAGGQLWSTDGTSWSQTSGPGFGQAGYDRVENLTVFRGQLYAFVSAAQATSGSAQIWRCTTGCESSAGWTKAVADGFGVAANQFIGGTAVFGEYLFAAVGNKAGTGFQLWRTLNGTHWMRVLDPDGFGLGANTNVPNSALAVCTENQRLLLATSNLGGAQIWMRMVADPIIYLPVVWR